MESTWFTTGIFLYKEKRAWMTGKVVGSFLATGLVPTFAQTLRKKASNFPKDSSWLVYFQSLLILSVSAIAGASYFGYPWIERVHRQNHCNIYQRLRAPFAPHVSRNAPQKNHLIVTSSTMEWV